MPTPGTNNALITPDWPAMAGLQAYSTTRLGGISRGPYAGLNCGRHVGDDPRHVRANRDSLPFSKQIQWLNQVHGSKVVCIDRVQDTAITADGLFSRTPGVFCAVMTADCLPVLLVDPIAREVAAIHAGWRGLAGGILTSAVTHFSAPQQVAAWLGPAIGPAHFEVGLEVQRAFDPSCHSGFTAAATPGKLLASLEQIVCLQLQALGVSHISASGQCTYAQPTRFFSFRRDGQTGRMATVIGLI